MPSAAITAASWRPITFSAQPNSNTLFNEKDATWTRWLDPIAALAVVVYAIVRTQFLTTGVATVLGAVPAAVLAVVFLLRFMNVFLSSTLVHVALAVAGATADAALATRNFANVPAHTILDALLASLVVVFYYLVPTNKSSIYDVDEWSIGPIKFTTSDVVHLSSRLTKRGILSLTWILVLPAAISNLASSAAVSVWIVGASLNTLLFAVGLFEKSYSIAVLAAIISIATRDYALSTL